MSIPNYSEETNKCLEDFGNVKITESSKLDKYLKESWAMAQFLRWLSKEKGIRLCKTNEDCSELSFPTDRTVAYLWAEFLGVDIVKLKEDAKTQHEAISKLVESFKKDKERKQ